MSGGIVKVLVMMALSVVVTEVNECLQSLIAPSVAVAEASVVSHSIAELEELHQLIWKAQEWKESRDALGDGMGE